MRGLGLALCGLGKGPYLRDRESYRGCERQREREIDRDIDRERERQRLGQGCKERERET